MQRILQTILRRWMHRSKPQQIFLAYLLLFLVLLLVLPILSLQELDAVDSRLVRFFWSGMRWIELIVLITIVKLVMLNSSLKWKKNVYQMIGRNNNEHMDNIVGLMCLLLIFLSISETVKFFGNNISTVIKPSFFFLILQLYLLGGVIRQAMITRVQWKQHMQQKTRAQASVTHDVDMSKKEREFKTADKNVEGLFDNK